MIDKHRLIQLMHKAGTLREETMKILTRVYEMTDEKLVSIADGTHADIRKDFEFEPLGSFCKRHGIQTKGELK